MFGIPQRPIIKFSGLGPGHLYYLKVLQAAIICSQGCGSQDSPGPHGVGMSLIDTWAILCPFLGEERAGSF